MKNLIIIIAICFSSIIHAQDITGQWFGTLDIQGTSLRIVFDIKEDIGVYSATMDSPDQGAKGIPTTSTVFSENVLTITADALQMVYTATITEEGAKLEGTFQQGPMELPLVMERTKSEVKTSLRPQDPEEFPYEKEDVQFVNTKENFKLSGTLTYPSDGQFDKVVVLITGSGPQNRDEDLGPINHRPFLVLSDYLTRNGIAVLRYDDRGVNESEGNFQEATSEDFALDVQSAVEYLLSREDMANKEIGLVGHSEGGMIAPIVASQNESVKFITLLAGPGTPIDQLMLKQSELIGLASGQSKEAVQANSKLSASIFDYVKQNTEMSTDNLKENLAHILEEKLPTLPQEILAGIKDEKAFIDGQIHTMTQPWFLNFIRFNPADYLSKVKCPVLAINGELDLQVPADDNLDAIRSILDQNGNENVTIKKFENQNHLFQVATTGAPSEYQQIEETFNIETMEYVTEWIKELSL